MGPVPVALIEQVFRFVFPCWIEHGQLAYQVIAQPASVCNRIAPLTESLIVFPRFLVGIDIPKVGEIKVRSSERAPNPRPIERRALQLRLIERRALQLRLIERRALQLRPIEPRALQLRSIERRALQLRLIEPRALQLRRKGAARLAAAPH